MIYFLQLKKNRGAAKAVIHLRTFRSVNKNQCAFQMGKVVFFFTSNFYS